MMLKRSWRIVAGVGGWTALLLAPATAASAARGAATARGRPAGNGPPRFWWAADSFPGHRAGRRSVQMRYLGGPYGGYIGMTGNWTYWLGLMPRAPEIAAGRRRWLFTGVVDQVAELLAASDGQLRIRTVQMRRDGMRR